MYQDIRDDDGDPSNYAAYWILKDDGFNDVYSMKVYANAQELQWESTVGDGAKEFATNYWGRPATAGDNCYQRSSAIYNLRNNFTAPDPYNGNFVLPTGT